jgi:hypothetical protein
MQSMWQREQPFAFPPAEPKRTARGKRKPKPPTLVDLLKRLQRSGTERIEKFL